MRLLVSACLLGVRCRYDGGCKPSERVLRLKENHELIPVCPEQLGGLSTPRPPAEIRGNGVFCPNGAEVTTAYRQGAEEALRLFRLLGCDGAVFKSRSPSCGCGQVYDGAFSGSLRPGDGITVRLFRENGIPLWTEEDSEIDSL